MSLQQNWSSEPEQPLEKEISYTHSQAQIISNRQIEDIEEKPSAQTRRRCLQSNSCCRICEDDHIREVRAAEDQDLERIKNPLQDVPSMSPPIHASTEEWSGTVSDGTLKALSPPLCSPNTARPANEADLQRSPLTEVIFQCSFCDSGFNEKARRDRHEKHHVSRGAGSHQCIEKNCGKLFTSKQILSRHIRSVRCVILCYLIFC